jgi:hypothetical protein
MRLNSQLLRKSRCLATPTLRAVLRQPKKVASPPSGWNPLRNDGRQDHPYSQPDRAQDQRTSLAHCAEVAAPWQSNPAKTSRNEGACLASPIKSLWNGSLLLAQHFFGRSVEVGMATFVRRLPRSRLPCWGPFALRFPPRCLSCSVFNCLDCHNLPPSFAFAYWCGRALGYVLRIGGRPITATPLLLPHQRQAGDFDLRIS